MRSSWRIKDSWRVTNVDIGTDRCGWRRQLSERQCKIEIESEVGAQIDECSPQLRS